MRAFKVPNHILYLFEMGINLALINATAHIGKIEKETARVH